MTPSYETEKENSELTISFVALLQRQLSNDYGKFGDNELCRLTICSAHFFT